MRIKKRWFVCEGVRFEEVTAPKMRGYYNAVANSRRGYLDIYDAYKNPSYYKTRSFRFWQGVCKSLRGENLRITSANCQSYTVVFDFVHPYDGDLCTAYITKDYTRFCSK